MCLALHVPPQYIPSAAPGPHHAPTTTCASPPPLCSFLQDALSSAVVPTCGVFCHLWRLLAETCDCPPFSPTLLPLSNRIQGLREGPFHPLATSSALCSGGLTLLLPTPFQTTCGECLWPRKFLPLFPIFPLSQSSDHQELRAFLTPSFFPGSAQGQNQ